MGCPNSAQTLCGLISAGTILKMYYSKRLDLWCRLTHWTLQKSHILRFTTAFGRTGSHHRAKQPFSRRPLKDAAIGSHTERTRVGCQIPKIRRVRNRPPLAILKNSSMRDQEFFSFDSFCAECQDKRPVQRSKADLVNATANDQNVRLFSIVCGHTWDLPASERKHLRDLLPGLSN